MVKFLDTKLCLWKELLLQLWEAFIMFCKATIAFAQFGLRLKAERQWTILIETRSFFTSIISLFVLTKAFMMFCVCESRSSLRLTDERASPRDPLLYPQSDTTEDGGAAHCCVGGSNAGGEESDFFAKGKGEMRLSRYQSRGGGDVSKTMA